MLLGLYGFTVLHALATKDLFRAHKDIRFSAYWGNLHTEDNILNHKKTPSRFSSSWRKASYGCNKIQAANTEHLHPLNTAGHSFHSSKSHLHSIYLIVQTIKVDHVWSAMNIFQVKLIWNDWAQALATDSQNMNKIYVVSKKKLYYPRMERHRLC